MNLHLQPRTEDELRVYLPYIFKKYGITESVYRKQHRKQKGLCGICQEPRRLNVDHSHQTQKFRGLLCYRCNGLLGWVEKYALPLRGLYNYIHRHKPIK